MKCSAQKVQEEKSTRVQGDLVGEMPKSAQNVKSFRATSPVIPASIFHGLYSHTFSFW